MIFRIQTRKITHKQHTPRKGLSGKISHSLRGVSCPIPVLILKKKAAARKALLPNFYETEWISP